MVPARRCPCLPWQPTFRVDRTGVKRVDIAAAKRLAVTHAPARSAAVLYLLGLSYGTVALALEALGDHLCKNQISAAVQAAARQVPGMKRSQVFAA